MRALALGLVALSLVGCTLPNECRQAKLVYEPAYPGEDPRIWQNMPRLRWIDPAECGRVGTVERALRGRGL